MPVDIDFPDTLPCVSRIDGFGMVASAAVIRTPLEFGNSRQRRMHARMPQEIALAWRVANIDLKPLTDWLNTYGYEWFNLKLAGLEASQANEFAVPIAVRLMSDIQVQLNPIYRQNWWTVSVSAEYQPPVSVLLDPSIDDDDESMMESTALFIMLTRYFAPEPEPERAYSDGFDEGFS